MPETLVGQIKVLSGWAFPSDGFNELEGLPLIRIRDLGRATTEVKFRGSYDPRYVIDDGDVLIGMDGDFSVQKWAGGAALLNQRVCKVESASENLDQGFLYWYLMPHVAEIHRKTPQTTVRHLSASTLSDISAPAILVAEQRTVNLILDTLDTTIRQTEAIIEKLKQVKQGLLHDLLTRGIDANGELRPPRSQAPHLYQDSPLGWIPREWDVSALAHVSMSVGDGVHYAVERSSAGVPFLFVSCVRNGEIDWSSASFVTRATYSEISKRSRPRKGMILFTAVGSYGHAAHVDDDRDFGFERNIAFVQPDGRLVHSRFLFHFLSSAATREQVERLVIGNAQKVLTLTALNSLLTIRPPIDEQSRICAVLDATSDKIAEEVNAGKKLRLQKSGLMDDLLIGRVRVTPLLQALVP